MSIKLQENLQKANAIVDALEKNKLARESHQKEPYAISQNINLKEAKAYQTFLRTLNGDTAGAPSAKQNLREMITSTDVVSLIPQVIQGQIMEAADPEYLAVNFFKKVQAPQGSVVVVVPSIGELSVKEMGEGMTYNEDAPDMNTLERSYIEINIKKFGLKISITEEAMSNYTWDIYNLSLRQMGRAFARNKEERCMDTWTKHGHVVFDNALRAQNPAAGTTGLGEDGTPNNTLSVEDFLDIMLVAMAHHHTPTDCIMHPLVWTVFARNAMIGAGLTFGALGGQNVSPFGATQGTPGFAGMQNNMGPQKFILSPDMVQNRICAPITMNFSPFVHFDKEKKLFDMYILDRNDVGVIAQASEIKIDNWTDPERDVMSLKANERYGVGMIANDTGVGSGVYVARNISVAPSYPKTLPIHVIADEAKK